MNNENQISNSNNPIQNIFHNVMNIGNKVKDASSFLDLSIGGNIASRMASGASGLFFNTMNRVDKSRFYASISSDKSLKKLGARELVETLSSQGLLSSGMEASLYGLENHISDGMFYYNRTNRSLFFGTSSGVFTPLPIQGIKTDHVTIGHTTRAVNTLGVMHSNNRIKNFSFTDAYYTALSQQIETAGIPKGNFDYILRKQLYKAKLSDFGPTRSSKVQEVLNLDAPIVFFDLETNGLQGEILQVAATKLRKGPDGSIITEHFNRYSPYTSSPNPESIKINNLTPEFLAKNRAAPFETYAKDLDDFFKGAILGGYNIEQYDTPLLRKALEKAGINSAIGQHGIIDVMSLYKSLGPGGISKGLPSAYKYYTGHDAVGAHNAVVDVEYTIKVLGYMLGRHKNLPTSVGAIASLMKDGGVALSTEQTTLKDLLQAGNIQRGVRSKYLGRSAGLRQKVDITGTELSTELGRFFEGKRVLSLIAKTSGRQVRTSNIGILSGMGTYIDSSAAFRIATAAMEAASTRIPGLLENVGLKGLWPLAKAEGFIPNKGSIILPTQLAGSIYGNQFSESAMVKGLHQLYKTSSTSNKQAAIALKSGIIPLRSYLTKGAFDAGLDFQHQGMSLRVGVVDFSNEMAMKAIFGEGGAILGYGASSTLSSTLPTHSVVLKTRNESSTRALHELFNINTAAGDLNNLNRALTFSEKDIKRAVFSKDITKLNKTQLAIRELIGTNREYLNVFISAAKHKSRLNSVSLREGNMKLDFISKNAAIPGSLEIITAGGRLTTVKALKNNRAASLLKKSTKGMHIDYYVASSEFSKMMPDDAYLEHFFATLNRNGMLDDALVSMGMSKSLVKLTGKTRSIPVPIGIDPATAVIAAQKVVKEMLASGGDKARIANEIQQGQQILLEKGLSDFGVTGLRVFSLAGGIRTDFMMDINSMKSTRITPGKMRMLALNSKMRGFKDPYDDAIFRAYHRGWKGKGIGIDKDSLDLALKDKHIARQFTRALIDGTISPNEASVLKVSQDGGLMLGSTKLKGLPSLEEFGYRKDDPGVLNSELLGTILDPKISGKSGVVYLDVGSETSIHYSNIGTTRSRYIPIPLKYLRADKLAGDRVVITKNHPAYNYMQILKIVENSPEALFAPGSQGYSSAAAEKTRDDFFSLVDRSAINLLTKIAGKGGLFEKTNTILLPRSFRARLIPNRGNPNVNGVKDLDEIFTIRGGRSELEEILYRRYYKDKALMKKGGWSVENMQNTKRSLKEKGFAYAMIAVDPMQRPEHITLVKLKVDRSISRDAKYGQLNIQANPLLMRMLERDTDRDSAFIHLVEDLMDPNKANQESLEKMMQFQKDHMKTFRWVYQSEMLASGSINGSPFGKIIGKIANHMFGDFMGQKTLSSLGYSFARPVDYFMHGLEGGDEAIKKLGIKIGTEKGMVPQSVIDSVIKSFVDDPVKGSMSEALVQFLYQGGVAKGQGKAGLVDIVGKITSTADKYGKIYRDTGVFDVQSIVSETKGSFKEFLASQPKNRAFATAEYILNRSNVEGVDLILKDLEQGADLATLRPDIHEKLLEGSAQLLAERYGVGHAFLNAFDVNINPVIGVIHTARTSIKSFGSMLKSKVVNPLAGMESQNADMIAPENALMNELRFAEEAARKSIKNQELLKKVSNFFEHPSTLKGFGIGLIAGAVGYLAYQNIITPNIEQPIDQGPQQNVPQMNRASIFGPGTKFSAKQGNPASITNNSRLIINGSQNIEYNIRDNRAPFDPRLAQAHMRRISQSDYTY